MPIPEGMPEGLPKIPSAKELADVLQSVNAAAADWLNHTADSSTEEYMLVRTMSIKWIQQ